MKFKSTRYKIFYALNIISLTILGIVCIYPFINSLAISLNESNDTLMGGISFFPRKLSFDNFKSILSQASIQMAFVVTTLRVVIVTALSIIIQFSAAYALTKKDLPGRNFLIKYFMIPMFISAGLIPRYILYGQLNLINSFWVYVLPGLFAFYYLVIIKANINTIPESLFESARLDGAKEFRILISIVIPLSLPILATVALWTAVANWSDWTTTLYFASQKKELFTLQYYIKLYMDQSRAIMEMLQRGILDGMPIVNPISLQAAQVMITTLPIVLVYPFVQKYFIKGVLTGSVKE